MAERMSFMESKQERMSWKDGWHTDGNLDYYIEDGRILRGIYGGKTVYPYLPCEDGGYDNASGIKANKRNYDRVSWF